MFCHHLLGDGGGAGDLRLPGMSVFIAGADHADVVEALVLVEVGVLGGEEGVAHVRGQGRDVDQRAALEKNSAQTLPSAQRTLVTCGGR